MSGMAIYMEGGGDGKDSKAALRLGMDAFLEPLKSAIRAKAWLWKLVCCGGRKAAFDAFQNAFNDTDYSIVVLLVDGEEPVVHTSRTHLQQRDGWNLTFASDDVVHLMVQAMEAWIAADGDALSAYYGQHFRANALPQAVNLENVSKADLAAALRNATRHTKKGEYHKIRHASDLLKKIDRVKVRQRCPNCARMFQTLNQVLQQA